MVDKNRFGGEREVMATKTEFDFTPFVGRMHEDIASQIVAMSEECGTPLSEATVVVAQFAMSVALGYTARAMGKASPTCDQVTEITQRIIGLVARLPDASSRDESENP